MINIKDAIKISHDIINKLNLKFINSYKVNKDFKPIWNSAIPTGSIRRQNKQVKDIDILIIIKNQDKNKIIDKIKKIADSIITSGQDEIRIKYKNIEIDFWFCTNLDYFGAMLLHTTGPAQYNMWLRKLAKDNGLLLNQYGLFKNNKRIAGKTEEEIYKSLKSKTNPQGKIWKEPKLRGL